MNGECKNCGFKMLTIGTGVSDDEEFISFSFQRACAKMSFELKNMVRNHRILDRKLIFTDKDNSCIWFRETSQEVFLLPKNCQECRQAEYCKDKTFNSYRDQNGCLYFSYVNRDGFVQNKISEMLEERQQTIEELIQSKKDAKSTANRQGIYRSEVICLNKKDVEAQREEDRRFASQYFKTIRTTNQIADEFGVSARRIRALIADRKVGRRVPEGWIFTDKEFEFLKPGKPGRRSV